MSNGLKDLEWRVTKLEDQTRIAASDAAEARLLARAADRDVSNMHAAVLANQNLINALRQTQLEQDMKLTAVDAKVDNLTGVVAEQGMVLSEHTATLAQHSTILDQHTATLAEHGQKLDALNDRVDALDAKVDELDAKVDEKFDSLDKKIDSRFEEVVALLRQRTDA